MQKSVAIIGAGVSGLTCGVLFAERGFRTAIFAREIGQHTTSAAAAAVWFPYDCEPADKVIPWALETYRVLVDLARHERSGVSMIELGQFSRTGEIQVPEWAIPLGASVIPSEVEESRGTISRATPRDPSTTLRCAQDDSKRGTAEESREFASGYAITVPLMDTTVYLDYLVERFSATGGEIRGGVRFDKLEDVDPQFDIVINCAGIGAREIVHDVDLESHRGQVVIVPKIDDFTAAIVCDEAPLMYVIPRKNDCVFGGTNELSDNLEVDPESSASILAECSRVLKIDKPRVLSERVGLRPFRKSGVRLEAQRTRDGRTLIHNYGHGGAGFTLSWGCAGDVVRLIENRQCD